MPGGVGPDDLWVISNDLLDACVGSLDEIPTLMPGEGLAGAPERRFVSPTEPVWDCCEMLVVHSSSISRPLTRPVSPDGARGTQHRTGAWKNEVGLTVTIGRCVPEGELKGTKVVLPSIASMEAAARQIYADGWALYNGISNRLYQGLLSEKCSGWKWDGVNSATPTGGCGGWTINFRAELDGYGATDEIST